MKKAIQIILILFVFIDCKPDYDKTDFKSVGEVLHNHLSKKDYSILKTINPSQFDTIPQNVQDELKKYEKFIDNKPEFFHIDTSTLLGFFPLIELSYFYDNDIFQLSFWYSRDSVNKIYIHDLTFSNITELCEASRDGIYCPDNEVVFTNFSWNTDYYKRSFTHGSLMVQNNSDSDIEYLKFRLKLKNKQNSWSSPVFFNRTIEYYDKIPKGDLVRIEINELIDYSTNFVISNDNLIIEPTLIQVLPFPNNVFCEKISELEIIYKSTYK